MTDATDDKLAEEIDAFRQAQQSLMLATLGEDGLPGCSYTPFATTTEGWWILVSALSRHTGALLQQPEASIMLIEDEQATRNPYARRRLTLSVRARVVPRDTPQWHSGLHALQERFGAVIDTLAGLADFHLFCLEPYAGQYVKGFGKAYTLSGRDLTDIQWIGQAEAAELLRQTGKD